MAPCTLKTGAIFHFSLFLQAVPVLYFAWKKCHCNTCIKFDISLATSHFFHALLLGLSLSNLIK